MLISLVGLLPLAAAALFILVCVLVVLRAVVAPAEFRRGAHCGGCGYELSRITDERCPECGARLIRVGVTTPAMVLHHRSSGLLAGLAWTSLVGLLGAMTFGIVALFTSPFTTGTGAVNQRVSSSQTFTPQTQWNNTTNQLERQNDYRISIQSDVVTDEAGMAESGEVTLTLSRTGGQKAKASIDVMTLEYTIDGDSQPEPFDADAAKGLIAELGFDAESQSVQNEASQIFMLVQAVQTDPVNYENALYNANLGSGMLQSSGSSVSFSPAAFPSGTIMVLVLLGFWTFVWLAGLVLINWRRRRLFGAAAARAP
jgi:hypothetical protein